MFFRQNLKTIRHADLLCGTEALKSLGDYGCLHFKTDVILGVSEPRYNKNRLERQKAEDKELIELDGRQKTKYEWQHASRRIECETRRQRDIAYMANASGDKILVKDCSDKIKLYRDKYDEICDTVGLEKRYNRMTTYYPKAVDKSGGSGIIKTENKAVNLNRKQKNIGKFSKIELPMQKREVEKIAKKYGVSLKGLTVKIQRDSAMLDTYFTGAADYTNIGRIDLFPNAFKSEPELLKTLIHEKCHVKQLQKYGKEFVQKNILLMEAQADKFESLYFKILSERSGD